MPPRLSLSCLTFALFWTIAVGIPAHAQSGSAAEVDRELVVRFTRAYGMAKVAFGEHTQPAPSEKERNAMLRQPDQLEPGLRHEVERILDLNGLQRDEWKMMFARMDADEDLRRRVESLSTPFQ